MKEGRRQKIIRLRIYLNQVKTKYEENIHPFYGKIMSELKNGSEWIKAMGANNDEVNYLNKFNQEYYFNIRNKPTSIHCSSCNFEITNIHKNKHKCPSCKTTYSFKKHHPKDIQNKAKWRTEDRNMMDNRYKEIIFNNSSEKKHDYYLFLKKSEKSRSLDRNATPKQIRLIERVRRIGAQKIKGLTLRWKNKTMNIKEFMKRFNFSNEDMISLELLIINSEKKL